jgi:hypothetical protein
MSKALKSKTNYRVGRMAKAWGTLVDIAPSSGYDVHIIHSSDADALRSDLERVRDYLNKARSIYDAEWSEAAGGGDRSEREVRASCRG